MHEEVRDHWTVGEEVCADWTVHEEVRDHWTVHEEVRDHWTVDEEVSIQACCEAVANGTSTHYEVCFSKT